MDSIGGSNRLRAMVIDDDPVIRKAAGRVVADLGFECEEFASGIAALERAEEWEPHFVMVDVEMPGLDGFATCMLLRERLGESVAILVATGHHDRETIDTAFEAGGTDFIDKPFDWLLLQHRIRFVMRAHTAFFDVAEKERRLAQAQRLAKVGHWEWKTGTDELICSPETLRILDLPESTPLSIGAMLDRVHPDNVNAVRAIYSKALNGETATVDHWVGATDSIIVRQQVMPIENSAGAIVAVSGTIQDITEHHRAAEQIRNLSYYDGLTGLPNQQMINEHIEDLVDTSNDTQSEFAVLRIGIDRFEQITESLGPRKRDEVILEVAARIDLLLKGSAKNDRSEAKGTNLAGRLTNDQFIIVSQDSAEAARVLASGILDIMRAPLAIEGQALAMSVSIGISLYPEDGDDEFSIIHSAEVALRDAAHACMGSYRLANPDMQSRIDRRMSIELKLHQAMKQSELISLFQPQWHSKTGRIVGVEQLARWNSDTLGPVSPGEFIPIAEETGLIVELTEWTIETACRQLYQWNQAGIDPLRISVNVSPRYVESSEGITFIRRMLETYQVDPTFLECEFTETAMIANQQGINEFAIELREIGIRTALDDFGTGYSSLQHLVLFPLDTVKIDLSFVMRLEHDPAARTICRTLLVMAQELGLSVVAEGVETEVQFDFLRRHGCEVMQGYLLSPAVTAEECIVLRDERMKGVE